MRINRQRLLELLCIQQDWVFYDGRWFYVKIDGEGIWCDGILIDNNWASGEEEVVDPIEERFEILDL